ncbi:hypothetical protein [Acidianus sp. RZ1]|uniref:hypothetical protein n=1 Tax=Acidianus sp. RZ1 TaxID=1540082 RepID=UPI001491831F|nr:hypothetical protein [Acidianus sp. RZ1]NON61550.1 hypothetical protein [Acidianus sp. RZ1]
MLKIKDVLNYISLLRHTYKNWLPITLNMTLYKLRLSGKKGYVGITKGGDRILGDYWFLISYANFLVCDKLFICENVRIDCKEAKEALVTKDVLPIYYNDKKVLYKITVPQFDNRYGEKAIIKYLAIPDFELFCGSYSSLDVKDSTVIDIGAYIGIPPYLLPYEGQKK